MANNPIPTIKGGKVLLNFQLQQHPDGTRDETGEQIAPPHWALVDPKGAVIGWGPLDTYGAILAVMAVFQIGTRKATHDELVAAGVIVVAKPKLWTPDDGAPEPGEVGSPEWQRWYESNQNGGMRASGN